MREKERCAEITAIQRIKMGTPGSGRKRTPVKDRFSAEDEALSNIAREAEARLAAKRAARAEARDIRMRELERQQKEFSQHSYDRKWAHIQKWMEDAERARYSQQSSRHSHLSFPDVSASHRNRASTSKRRDLGSGIYCDQRNYSRLGYSKPVPSYHVWSSSLYSDPVAPTRSYRPSEYSYSSRASSVRSSPVSSDFSDQSETTADYFSRSNRRGSIVSDADDGQVLNSLEEKSEKSHSEIFSRPSSRNSVGATPLSGNSSRRGSGDASSLVDPDASLSELRDSLAEVEEKYKKAMVSNAQLDNEKNNLIYQVDTLKDVIEEKEEQIAEFYRENEEKSKELERQKHTCSILQHKLDELKEGLRQRDELIEKHGLVIIPDGTPNGDVNHESVVGTITVVSQEAAQVLESAGEGPLDIRLRKLAGEKEELLSQVRKLKMQLEEERQKYSKSDGMNPDIIGLENGSDLQLIEMQRDANRQISEYKFKLSKAEQDITTLEQNIGRLEGQVARYKNAAENAEKVEDELKAEKRKLQRELRTALDKIEEMEMTNSHLMKRLEKMKANRTALLSQQ
ncbi:PREDICTED: leucine-rich repeat flightless-interacting protein 2 isoform X6 [Pseudopodoces humilis]|uniref:leucine-rich repeat flightless-interacting protein 2 isoform X6 n=1 Tax=Pseudopodoces humilis TaxID=181119 RepID=UPI0006B7D2EA|nr:PREDICTED: leucine-rich repeat flightless-interacting protein 2 isoform X6 [Pseudopodoces humilis]